MADPLAARAWADGHRRGRQHRVFGAYWIGQLARRYNEQGPQAMRNRQHTRPRPTPTLLSSAQIEELRQALAGPAPTGERWSGRVVGEWIAARIGRPVRYQTGWAYLQRLQARQRWPRPQHVAASAEEQEAFKGGSPPEPCGGDGVAHCARRDLGHR